MSNQNNPDMWASLLSAATMSDPVDAQNKNGGGGGDGGGNIGVTGGAGMSPPEYNLQQQQPHPAQGGGYQFNNPDGTPPGGPSSPFGMEDLQQYRQYPNNNNNDDVTAFPAHAAGGPENFQRQQFFQQPPHQQFEEEHFRVQQQYQQQQHQQDHLQYQHQQDQYREQQIRQQYLQQQQSLDQRQHQPSDRRADEFSFGRVMGLNDDNVDDRLRTFDNREMQVSEQVGAPPETNNGGRNNSNNVFNPIETDNIMNDMGGKEDGIDAPKAALSPPTKDDGADALDDDVGSPTMDIDDSITKGKDDDLGGGVDTTITTNTAMVNHSNEDKMVDPFAATLDGDDETKNVTNNHANNAPNDGGGDGGGVGGDDDDANGEDEQRPRQEEVDSLQKQITELEEERSRQEKEERKESGMEETVETEEERIRREEEIHVQKEEEEQKRLEEAKEFQQKEEEQRKMEEELRRLEEEEFQRQQREVERQEEEEKQKEEEEEKQQVAEADDLVRNEQGEDMQQKMEDESPPKELEAKQQTPTGTTTAPESNEGNANPPQHGSETKPDNELAKETEEVLTLVETSAVAKSNDDSADNPPPTAVETKAEDDSSIQPISKEDTDDVITTTNSQKVADGDKNSEAVVNEGDQGTVEEQEKEKGEIATESKEQTDAKTTTTQTKDTGGNAGITEEEKEDLDGPSETAGIHVAEPRVSTEEEGNKAATDNAVSSIAAKQDEEEPATRTEPMEIEKSSPNDDGEAADISKTSISAKQKEEEDPATVTEPMEIDKLSANEDGKAANILKASISAKPNEEDPAIATEPMEINKLSPNEDGKAANILKASISAKPNEEDPAIATEPMEINKLSPNEDGKAADILKASISDKPNEEDPAIATEPMEINKLSPNEDGKAADILKASISDKPNEEDPAIATEPMEINKLSPNEDGKAADILKASISDKPNEEEPVATTEPMKIDEPMPQDDKGTSIAECETKEAKESMETSSAAAKDLNTEEELHAKPVVGESSSSPLLKGDNKAEMPSMEATKDEIGKPTTEPTKRDAPSSKEGETIINNEVNENSNKEVVESSSQVAKDESMEKDNTKPTTTTADVAEGEKRSTLPQSSNKVETGINKERNENNNKEGIESSSLAARDESMEKDHAKPTTTAKVADGEKPSALPLEGNKEKEKSSEPPKYVGPLTPNQLYLNRCDKCDLCLKPDCQQCTSCFNSSFLKKSRKQVCFRKMCCNIDIIKKAQPIPKFPGWYFWFDKPSESSLKSDLQGLFLSSPEGKQITAADFSDFTSTKELASVFPNVDNVQSKLSDFYQYIGFLNSQRKRRSVNYTQDDLGVMEEEEEEEKEEEEGPPPPPKQTKKRSATTNSSPTSKRRKTSATTKSEPAQSQDIKEKPPPEKDDEPEIGDRVYSCFDDDDNWYWGKVTDKFKKGDSYHYSIQYDDGDYIEDFDPIRGIATEAHYKAGMVPDDPEACKLDDGKVEQKSAGNWTARIDYARKNRFLGTFRTKQEATKYLAAVKEILESFGKTRDEVNSMSDTQGRKAVQRAKYEAEASLGIFSKKGGDEKPAASASNKRKKESNKKELNKRKSGGGAKSKKAKVDANESKNALEKIIQDSLKSLDESSKAGSKVKADEPSKGRPKMKAGKSTGNFQNARPKMQAGKSTYQGKTRAAVEYHTDSNILRELHSCRCKNCVCCCLSACGRCEPCIRNMECNDESLNEVCLRKMCCKIDVDKKALPATGFPQGWRFIFDRPIKTMSVHLIEDYVELDGLRLLAPNGRKYTSVEKAINHNPTALSNFEEIAKFYKIIGQPMYHEDNQHILIGRGVCQEWTDLHNRKKVVYGVITHAEKKGDGDEANFVFTVQYNENSRALANSLPNTCGSSVPSTKFLKSELAWGGCLNFEDKRRPLNRKRPLRSLTIPIATWDWITPDMRYEELGDVESNKLPMVTLGVRGYQLVFTVKQSSIPNAGLGVFVKATKCVDGSKGAPFELKQGEMLDLGIYAPFLATDKKKEPAFFVKNFIHSFATEEWGFDTVANDSMFDITDDHSGNIHEQAKRHLPAYVNECSSLDEPTVRAEHDPEGNVHYLLGVLDAKKLSIPVNGEEVEIFVNYGPHYENVRLRKGYSELPAEEQTKKLEKLANEDLEYLNDVDNFSAEDVSPCLIFFENFSFQSTSQLVRQRSLKILKVLDERCQKILESEAEAVEKAGLQSCRNRIKSLSAQLHESTSYVLDLDQIDSSLDNPEELTEKMHVEKPVNLEGSSEKMPAERNEYLPGQEELQPGGLESTTAEAGTHEENLFPSQDTGNLLGQHELQLGGLESLTNFTNDTPGTQN